MRASQLAMKHIIRIGPKNLTEKLKTLVKIHEDQFQDLKQLYEEQELMYVINRNYDVT